MERIIELIKCDALRLNALNFVYQLELSECYIAAGFIRNLIWDHLHHKTEYTLLNDIDVIYFDRNEDEPEAYLKYEAKLTSQMPQVNWQVRNQAKMHERNGDIPYFNVIDAMSYWPEKETAIAIRQLKNKQFECVSPFSIDSLFNFNITYNPKRSIKTFEDRLASKDWLTIWPNLKVKM